MFRIGDFSRITGLPVRTLRFYQEKGLLVPTAVDDASGYRYYNAASVEKARVIVALRAFEFSLEDIGAIIRDHDDEADILDYLDGRKAKLRERIRCHQDMIRTLDRIIRTEREARQAMALPTFQVEEKNIPPMLVAGVRLQGKYSDCGKGFAQLGRAVGRLACGKPFCLYYDDEYREDDADFEACMPVRKPMRVDGISVHELPGERLVTLLHRGPYSLLGRSYARILESISEHRQSVVRPTREVYLKGPGMIFKGNPKNYLTEIQLPIAE
ncbi:MAG TPA: MerR family transcriptional regulator [Isosphaeraceae bacterium]|nr:MerR family transcriptional regulator [Isosphaeraceae bacterium]